MATTLVLMARRAGPPAQPISRGVSWDFCVRVLLVAALATSSAAPVARLASALADQVGVIVRELPGTGNGPEQIVRRLGGQVQFQLPLINGFAALLPAAAISLLSATAGVAGITPDGEVHFNMAGDGYNATDNYGSLYNTAKAIGATELWSAGITGQGIDVAVIDTGVNPEAEFNGRLLNGPDVSFDGRKAQDRYIDGYGHGTHMASIIGARDPRLPAGASLDNPDYFVGIAPGARILNVKVGSFNGVTDVSQVIAAIDWVVQHRNTDGLNIRVLNLSFGTNGKQDYIVDPLTYAVERAWFAGIVVVASAGNEGFGTDKLDNPSYDPFVIAVGASALNGTLAAPDDTVPDFSNRGVASRRPDLVAPGKSVIGLRAYGSYLDSRYPEGRVGTRYFKGSGTSQATAVVSGAAALLLSSRPFLKPDQVKKLLMSTATDMPAADAEGRGEGRINVAAAESAKVPWYVQTYTKATGHGSLHLARGSAVIKDKHGVPLIGDKDIFGHDYSVALSGNSWSGGAWNGNSWSGNSWSGKSWSGNSWSGNSWSGNSWSVDAWEGNSWSGNSWSGAMYSMAKVDCDDSDPLPLVNLAPIELP
ncbi:MAG: S8 family serine peptidase [Chloroflexota bacterium]